mmetsp:Transcript_9908/g.15117  ORF Transcript_9908/g.15117 Transcript_9908/m.15117 type:complete len:187 (-) Transcript_9908:347-907(-)|eukprot:CAMPEP_0113939294 /NCGR_PEP_ID=MMETSP1339-20121228/5635_1 /TAXON_ID=94617 /ORGANISM="Fibrocapsa japonica" /LENGTH=186 /DNA_ID=CAMNT_0000942761 /DNA_START=146 /DNA_END=706 /DNA_ORIENTATION=+ /assembly_acc=CAM_ASM_000762
MKCADKLNYVAVEFLFWLVLLFAPAYSTAPEKLANLRSRLLPGSNCYYVSEGVIPPYEHCIGCQIPVAVKCVEDMRMNISGNVPAACNMNTLSVGGKDDCCPIFGGDDPSTILFTTSAYPDALLCLRENECEASAVSIDLQMECETFCGEGSQCQPTQSRAGHISAPVWLKLFVALAAAVVIFNGS